MPEPDPGADGGAADHHTVPKLTMGQRVLASLPNLQRTRPTRSSSSGAAGESDAVSPDEVIDPGRNRTTSSPKRGAYQPGGRANPYAEKSVEELRHGMKYLDDKERGLVMLLGPFIAVLDVILTIITIHGDPAVGHKGHFDATSQLIVGLASAGISLVVMVAALVRRRSFALFTLLFSGFGGGFLTIVIGWIGAGYLFVHFNRMQKTLVAKTGGPAAARGASSQARAERLAARRKALEERRRTGRRAAPAQTGGPGASKRYTPPRPTPPRPKA